jgi:tetratricopeptide (TPR) repeat protein
MRRINWKFAAILLLVVVVTSLGAWGLYVFQSGRIAQSLLDQARKDHDEGRVEAANKLASQYLQFRPTDVAVMVELADWMRAGAASRKQFAAVIQLYEKALRLQSGNDDIRRKAVDAYFALGQYGEALDHVERLLQTQPNDAALLTQAGRCLFATGKFEASADYFRRAIRADARYVGAYVYAAGLQQSQFKNLKIAGELLDQAVAANPESPEARAALGGHLRRQRKFDDAARCVKDGLDRQPDNALLLLTASEIASAAGDFRQSRALLDRGCSAHPKDTRFVCALAWQLLYDGRADLAAEKLRAAKATNPNDIDVLTLLADVLAQDGQIGPLETALKELQALKATPDKIAPRVQYVEARLQMCRGRYGAAVQKLNNLRLVAIRMPSLNRQVNALLAECCCELGDSAGELDAIQRLLESDPNAGAMRLEYARALARAKKHDDALREFLAVLPRSEVSSRLVAVTARTVIAQARSDAAAWANLERAIEKLTFDDANANPTIARAELDRFRNRPDVALAQIVKNLAKLPRNATLHAERAALFELKFGPDQALLALTEGEQLAGEQADLRLTRARLLAERVDRSQAALLTALSQNVEQFTSEDRSAILREIIAGCRLIDDPAAIQQMLRRWAQVCPDNFASREALYAMAIRGRDIVRREALRQEIEALEGKDGPCLHRLEAERLVGIGSADNLKQAEAHLTKCAEQRPADPVIAFVRGRIAEISSHGDTARELYGRAFDRGFLDRPIEELLLAVRGAAGNQPTTVLSECIAARITAETRTSVVVSALPLFDTAARVRLAERLVAQCPADHAMQQAELGRLFARMGLSDQSEAAFRRAASAAPQGRDGWLSLLADRKNDPARFAATVAEVRQSLSPFDSALLIGRAFETVGKFDDARAEYQKAAVIQTNDPRPLRSLAALAILTGRSADAYQALEALSKLNQATYPEDVRWARRTLALQLAIAPSLANFQRAMGLLDQNKVGESWIPDDLRARALVLATQKSRPMGDGSKTARQEAIANLESLLQRNSVRNADDLLLLAKLLRAENDSDNYQRVLDRLRVECRGHYGAVVYLAREALRDSDTATCEKWLPVLKQLGPNQFDTLAVEFYCRAIVGEFGAAQRLFTDYVAAASTPSERVVRSSRVAYFLFDLLRTCPMADRASLASDLRNFAIQQFSTTRSGDPEALQRRVTLLAQNNQVAVALELLQNGRATFPADVIASAQMEVLRNGTATESQRQATERFLMEQCQKNPASVGLRISLADFYQFVGNNDRAITLYRQILAAEPNNVAALNNLAWTLAADHSKTGEALTLVQRAIDLIGPLDDLLDTRARIRFQAGDVPAAVRDLAEAVNEAPTATRMSDLAAMYRKAGQPEMADRLSNRARLFAQNAGDSAPR